MQSSAYLFQAAESVTPVRENHHFLEPRGLSHNFLATSVQNFPLVFCFGLITLTQLFVVTAC